MDIAITSVDCYAEYGSASDVVYMVYAVASDGGGQWPFSQQLVVGDGPFTPYDDLTEAVIRGWVTTALGSDGIAAIEAKLAALNEAPVVTSPPLPWAAP